MQVSNVNDVKIYNLSSGKSVPEWLSAKRRKKMLRQDATLRNRIELIQDFEMPAVSTGIQVSPDGQYIMATGVYKPRVRCFDVNQLAMKFERCFDSEVIRMHILSDDFTKMIFLQEDRWIEFHSQFGRYHRLRIPKAGHDMCYHKASCDLYIVGEGSSVYRLNLEAGKFSETLVTDSSTLNVCELNPVHNLFVCGSLEGTVEAFDPRSGKRAAKVDCALSSVTQDTNVEGLPSITALSFKDGLHMGVGTATGQILLYDIRSSKPYIVKDHMYGLPIKKVTFLPGQDLVASIDSKILKMWHRENGKPFSAIQTKSDLNDLAVIPDTGMMFLANEDKKILTYYLPCLGPAPRWCSFLDRIVEELEETGDNNIYDDYKFVTQQELEDLGLEHLMGTNLLRAYMHGFFMDIRLYHKAKLLSDPFAYEEYKKKKIKDKLESERGDRVQPKGKLPKVNRELARKLLEEEEGEEGKVSGDEDGEGHDIEQSKASYKETSGSKSKKSSRTRKDRPRPAVSLLHDERFKAMFENPDFEVDHQSEDFKSIAHKMS
ncbi:Nucleolar protein 10 [Halotydeus destructor]|nr:Nucleolar protein 10 [Halotydeus destructor]